MKSCCFLILLLSEYANSIVIGPGDVSQGLHIFQKSCASCHIGGSNAISKERNLRKNSLEKFIGLEDEKSISSFIQESRLHRGALAFRGKLNDKDIADVSAFVYQQAVEEKWLNEGG